MTDDRKKGFDSRFNSPQELIQIMRRGTEFTEEVLKENETLRFRVAELESQLAGPSASDDKVVRELLDRVGELEKVRDVLTKRFEKINRENTVFAERYSEIESENNTLLNIYVASYQLHSTLDFDEVMNIITEILLNLVGAEVFTISLLESDKEGLSVQAAEGIDALGSPIPLKESVVGEVVRQGEPRFDESRMGKEPYNLSDPPVCIPLRTKSRSIGAVSMFKFLDQKEKLSSLDYELFTLLGGHAATAIFAAKLYTGAQRKLDTIQNFIDMVSS